MSLHLGETILAVPQSLHSAVCIPQNDTLMGPLSKPLTNLEGALGGVLFGIVTLVVILLAILCIVTILSKKSQGYLKAIAIVLGLPLLLIVLLIAYNAIIGGFNNAC